MRLLRKRNVTNLGYIQSQTPIGRVTPNGFYMGSIPNMLRSFSNVRKLTIVCVPNCPCARERDTSNEGASENKKKKVMSKTYPTPTHAEAFEERHGTFVDEDAPHAVEDTIQLSAFVSHETYFHDVWRRTNSQISRQVHTAGVGGAINIPTGLDVIEQNSLTSHLSANT